MNTHRPRAMLFALLMDLLWGDPPNQLHPVAWMGQAIAMVSKFTPTQPPSYALVSGGLLTLVGNTSIYFLGMILERLLARLPSPLNWMLEGACLKSTFSLRGLTRAASQVKEALDAGDLPEARRLVSWHLVSRDTSQLDQHAVAAATIESVAENASDGIVSPLLYYCLGGLPLALVYRFTNTTDSMLGYRDAAREWLGKIPARWDDLINLLPSRLTAILICLASLVQSGNISRAWKIIHRDARKTASPNAGFPMSAMAGALGVELEKRDHYRLGEGQRLPEKKDIPTSIHLLKLASFFAVLLLIWMPSHPSRKTSLNSPNGNCYWR